MKWLLIAVAMLGAVQLGCSVELSGAATGDIFRNECERSSDCPSGSTCRLGLCVAPSGAADTVLLEVTPPVTTETIGGVRFLRLSDGFSSNQGGDEMNIPLPSKVRGFVSAYDVMAQAACLEPGRSTLPVQVTLTPREQLLGLPASSLVAIAARDELTAADRRHPICGDQYPLEDSFIYEFELNVPAGNYDVYVESVRTGAASETLAEECVIVPRLIPDVLIEEGKDGCLAFPRRDTAPRQPKSVRVEIIGSAEATQSFNGWFGEIVLETTGRAISTRVAFRAEETKYVVDLLEHPPLGGSPGESQSELIRISPPEGQVGPTIQFVLSAALTFDTQVATIPGLTQLPAAVQIESWLWKKTSLERDGIEDPTAATVTLTATKLEGIEQGIFASYSTTVDVAEDGKLSALVLPGTYRARVVPPVGSGLAATEDTFEVPCTPAEDPSQCDTSTDVHVQGGRALFVPDAVSVVGQVTSKFGAESVRTSVVTGHPAQLRTRRCDVGDAGAESGAECSNTTAGVLDYALGDDEFVPRTVTGSVVEKGRFELAETDCGECTPGNGAFFDIVVRPVDGSGLPWAIRQSVAVEADEDLIWDLGSVPLPLPVARQGVIQVPQAGGAPVVVPGALIRAYVVRDNVGAYVTDAESLPTCADDPALTDRCIRSILQVAETRSADDGSFTLLIPSTID